MPTHEDPTLSLSSAAGGPDAPVPAFIEGYQMVSTLAAGGFGTVYRALDIARGVTVALKVLHEEFTAEPAVILRFEREVEAIRRIRHPNVIEILEKGRLPDGRPYFAMELLEGVSLRDHLEVRGRLSPGEAIAILDPLCEALAAAHDQAIVHRDVKASNVFLKNPGPEQRVILLDFGVAKLLDAEGPGITSSRQIVGTIACMAPEQILGRPVDARTDVYALGALAYRMLTGELPFHGRTLQAMQQMHLYASPQPLGARAPVSQALSDFILRALAKDPAARPRDARAFLAECLAATRSARPEGLGERSALAVYIEVVADPEAMDAPDDGLLDDLEGVLLDAAEGLQAAGFRPALATGTSRLAILKRPADPARDADARHGAVKAVLALNDALARRPGRDARVHVHFCLHVGALGVEGERRVAHGRLLTFGDWVPSIVASSPTDGVFASSLAIAGLDLDVAQPDEPSGMTDTIPLGEVPTTLSAALSGGPIHFIQLDLQAR